MSVPGRNRVGTKGSTSPDAFQPDVEAAPSTADPPIFTSPRPPSRVGTKTAKARRLRLHVFRLATLPSIGLPWHGGKGPISCMSWLPASG